MNLCNQLEYVRAVGHFLYFLRYFSASKFDPNGNLQNDKKSKLCIPCRKQKRFFLIKVICFLGLKKTKPV